MIDRKRRILVGTIEIAGQIVDFAGGFRQLGHEVTTVVRKRDPFFRELQYDVHLNLRLPDRIRRLSSPIVRVPRGTACHAYRWAQALRLISSHDLFVFQFAGSLLPNNWDYPILRRLGKQIIAIFNGSDILHWSAYFQELTRFCVPVIGKEALLSADGGVTLARKLRRLRVAERYCDAIFSVPSLSGLALRPYFHIYLPIDTRLYEPCVPDREVPLVVHAPSHRGVKGTDLIVGVLKKLASEGIRFELRLIENMPNSVVRDGLRSADILVDQLYSTTTAKLSLEGLASSCAVATGNWQDFAPIPPDRPVWPIDPDNLYEQLKRLLTDRELRLRLARAGRPFVEKYHDRVKVAEHILRCLEARENGPYDYHPEFFARSYQLPEGETVPPRVKRLTREVVAKWGLPAGVHSQDLVRRGLM